MQTLRAFLHSPLARHPGLLGRKVAARLRLYREQIPAPAPGPLAVVYPPFWAEALRRWVQQVQLQPPPHPFNRVFGHDLDEAMLLSLCREGPRRTGDGLTADVKLGWEYSRGQPLFTNAAADPARPAPCAAFIHRWLDANANTTGPAWGCAMEIAIRAVNWVFADSLFSGGLGRQIGEREWAGWLWRHGWLIWRRLESRLVSSNHYLADLLGLLVIGTIFPDDAHARRWRRFARREFPRALLAQTRSDGGLIEASLRYHAYATEMALLFRLAQGTPFPHPVERRLQRMCRIVAEFRDATGEVFPFGDDDSGRVLALDFAAKAGRVEILLRLASSLLQERFESSGQAVFPHSGWWVRRAGDFAVALDFGGVGLYGAGAHAHNDDFSFCLDWQRQTVITDPGTCLYTGDPETRNRFRSTLAHNTLVVDGREQNDLDADLFKLPGSDKAFRADRLEGQMWAFTRQAAPGISHRREVSLDSDGLLIRDVVGGAGRHKVQWRFHLHPAVQPHLRAQGFTLAVPGTGALCLESPAPDLALKVLPSAYSPLYSWSLPAQACAAETEAALPMAVKWRLRLAQMPLKASG